MVNRKWMTMLLATLLCIALLSATAMAEDVVGVEVDMIDIPEVAIEVEPGEDAETDMEGIPELALDLSLDDGLALDLTDEESIALPNEGEGVPEGIPEGTPEGEPVQIVPLNVTYTGGTLSKVYDLNMYGVYVKSDGSRVYVIEDLRTISEKFKLEPAAGSAWIDEHKDVRLRITLSKQFDSSDVGRKYKFEFKFELTGADVAYYKLNNKVINVPAEITPREVVITPRKGLSKVYGTKDPVYPDGSWLSQDTTSPLHQDISGLPGYAVPVTTEGGSLRLSVTNQNYLLAEAKKNNTKFFPNDGWLSREAGEDVGTYRINIGKMNFGRNFDTKLEKEVFTILPKDIGDTKDETFVVDDIPNQNYTGSHIKPDVVIHYGSMTLAEGTDYRVTYENNVKVGTAKATIKGRGNYTGTREVTFSIVKSGGDTSISISRASVEPISDKTYKGKAIKPSPVLRYNGKTLKAGRDYELTYANNVSVGQAKITIIGKGSFRGSRAVTFNIIPKGAKFTKVTGKGKQITLNWKKARDVSGYQIEYCVGKKTAAGSGINIDDETITSYTIAGLKAGKKYYIRIRTYKTVRGKNYYSAWSAYKKVKTK